jgi:TolA-binding protein
VDSSKNLIQQQYDAAMVRLDSVSGAYNDAQGIMKDRSAEIARLKEEVRNILSKKSADKAELGRAQNMIAELNGKIDSYVMEIEKLKGENQQLTAQNVQITSERDNFKRNLDTIEVKKQELEKTVEIASTFSAYNIKMTPIDERRKGREKVKDVAKRVDKLRISFDVDNRIAKDGKTDFYVCMKAPDGTPVSVEALGSGKFTTREEGEKGFTFKVPVDYQPGQRKHIDFDWKQNSKFQTGDYKIEVYQNGFKIGESNCTLKKGGLFS